LSKALLLLDRDGVLNEMVVDPEHGTINSPLHPDQVTLRPGVGASLMRLRALGYLPVVVTNQPAASKGLTTRSNLESVHARVLDLIEKDGGRIEKSYICFHRSEEACACRKPKTGLLESAHADFPLPKSTAWMVGDGMTDIEAGVRFGVSTAYVGSRKTDAMDYMASRGVRPTLWVTGLADLIEKFEMGEK
jgi:D-glycero-D-manno-heptose 1,7-bisphosphate phosphatase